MNTFHRQILCCILIPLLAITARAAAPIQPDWNVTALDQLLASVPSGQSFVQIDDMQLPVAYLQAWRNQLAGGAQSAAAFSGTLTTWPGGNVYYAFSNNVSAVKQKAFLDGVAEWATFANLHFIPRSTQTNYVTVFENPAQEGGQSYVGMANGGQFLSISPDAWNRPTICHEIGHLLGLVHEHQRSDRTNYVNILTNNIPTNALANFVILTDSQNKTVYDFLSIMHYSRNYLSVSNWLDTIETVPAYNQYLNLMGQLNDPVLSAGDRAGMAAVYGAGPGATSAVTNTQDSGPGSLRTALYYAYDHPGTTITFNLPISDPGFSNNVFNLQPSFALPGLWGKTTLDATTQPTNPNPNGPAILLNGAISWQLSPIPSGLRFRGTNSVARGFVINGFPNCGVLFDGSNTVGNVLSGCYLGIDPSGAFAVTNGFCPVQISSGAISNIVGGITFAARNVISGSAIQGVVIRDPGTRFNVVEGNYIGLNPAGTATLGNGTEGVDIFSNAAANVIGGISPGAGNVISGNGAQGVLLQTGASGNSVQGNLIGLNAAGSAAVPNGWVGIQFAGVEITTGAQSNLIGGLTIGARNVISGNTLQGVLIDGAGTTANRIEGNFIGLDPAGTTAIGNGYAGVDLATGATENFVGGSLPGAGNVISGNHEQGVLLQDAGTSGNFAQGNYIGLNADGNAAIPNTWSGVEIFNGASANLVGGYGGARNFISGNANYGVYVDFDNFGNTIQGNTIGLNATNGAVVANGFANVGIYVACSNLVGGVSPGAANLISGSPYDGIQVSFSATNNTIRGNSIFNNGGSAISIFSGGNNELAAPVLTSAVVTTNTAVSGTYSGLAGHAYWLDFYSDAPPASTAEGMTYLGTISITGTGGSSAFNANLGVHLPAGRAVTASVTDSAGNTSPLSPGIAATMTSSVNDGIPDAWRAKYFGGSGATTNSQSDAFADPDHDGMSNYQEFLAGTNPTNAASALKLTALSPIASTNVVSLNSSSGTVYRILSRNDLLSSNWAILADQVLGTGTNILFWDPATPVSPKRFYRAEALW